MHCVILVFNENFVFKQPQHLNNKKLFKTNNLNNHTREKKTLHENRLFLICANKQKNKYNK